MTLPPNPPKYAPGHRVKAKTKHKPNAPGSRYHGNRELNEKRALCATPAREASKLWLPIQAHLKTLHDETKALAPSARNFGGTFPTPRAMAPAMEALAAARDLLDQALVRLREIAARADEAEFEEQHGMTREEYYESGEELSDTGDTTDADTGPPDHADEGAPL